MYKNIHDLLIDTIGIQFLFRIITSMCYVLRSITVIRYPVRNITSLRYVLKGMNNTLPPQSIDSKFYHRKFTRNAVFIRVLGRSLNCRKHIYRWYMSAVLYRGTCFITTVTYYLTLSNFKLALIYQVTTSTSKTYLLRPTTTIKYKL